MTEDERKLHLDYLSRVHVALTETGKRINTTLLAQTLVAFVVLAICLDIVSSAPEYFFAGLKLTGAAPFVIIAGAFTCCGLLLQQFGLLAHESMLQVLMLSIYQDLGFNHPSLDDRIAHPLEHPNLATSVVSLSGRRRLSPAANQLMYSMSRFLMTALFLAVPIAAQIAVIWRLTDDGQPPYVIALPCIAAIVSLVYASVYSRKEHAA